MFSVVCNCIKQHPSPCSSPLRGREEESVCHSVLLLCPMMKYCKAGSGNLGSAGREGEGSAGDLSLWAPKQVAGERAVRCWHSAWPRLWEMLLWIGNREVQFRWTLAVFGVKRVLQRPTGIHSLLAPGDLPHLPCWWYHECLPCAAGCSVAPSHRVQTAVCQFPCNKCERVLCLCSFLVLQ